VSIPEKKIINHAPFSTKDIDAMALQHPQVLHGTLDNSSICEMFVATDDLRAPIQNQETPWLDS
jgi:hypothetical protein